MKFTGLDIQTNKIYVFTLASIDRSEVTATFPVMSHYHTTNAVATFSLGSRQMIYSECQIGSGKIILTKFTQALLENYYKRQISIDGFILAEEGDKN